MPSWLVKIFAIISFTSAIVLDWFYISQARTNIYLLTGINLAAIVLMMCVAFSDVRHNGLNALAMSLIVIFLFCGIVYSEVRWSFTKPKSINHIVYLTEIALVVKYAQNQKEKVPTGISAFSRWAEGHRGMQCIMNMGDLACDHWNEPLVIISENGKVTGIGSKGPDKKWDGGKEDDIVVMLADVEDKENGQSPTSSSSPAE